MSIMEEERFPYLASIPPIIKEASSIDSGAKVDTNPNKCEEECIGTPLKMVLLPPLLAPLTKRPKVPSIPWETPGRLEICLMTSGSPTIDIVLKATEGE